MNIAVLISGRGSNLQAILDAGIEVSVVLSKFTGTDQELIDELEPHNIDLIVLAGYMRILGPLFINAYEGRIINIHPSLLPKHKGLNTHQRVLDAGEKWHGCTIHFVTEELDAGPMINQWTIPVLEDDTAETLAARVLKVEHRLYPKTIKSLCAAGQIGASKTLK
jgi:phosphoribosylglycinamide formyltransferase-1